MTTDANVSDGLANGLPSADELAGRHVHKGGVVAVATCCVITPKVPA